MRKLASRHARVLRGGTEQSLEARELVPGDALLLGAGDAVGADARLFEAAALEVAEAALTGESLPVSKHPAALPEDTSVAERRNMIYSGTHIAAGRGRAIVVATALDAEVEKIATLTAGAKDPQTPLELRIAQSGQWLAGAAVIYTEPMNRIFHTVPISLQSFFLIGAAGSVVLWVEEVRKFIARRPPRDRRRSWAVRRASRAVRNLDRARLILSWNSVPFLAAETACENQKFTPKSSLVAMTPPKIRNVGAAISMTPQSDALLAEASRFAERLGVPLTLIHTGTSETESRAFLEAAAGRLAIPHEQHIVWNQTEPAQALASAAEMAAIELLVVGAFEGPALGRRRFLGPIPRQLADRARCSLLLVAHPRVEAHDFRRLVVITDFSPSAKLACEHAFWLAGRDAAECVHVVSIHTIFMKARAETGAQDGRPARTRAQEEEMMHAFLADLPDCAVPVDWHIVEATTGFAACEFADSVGADLLVLPGHDRPEGRIPPMADWALQVVPCSLWIVHCGPTWSRRE